MKKIAVVLSGAGFLDGAEIHESVMTLLAIDKRGIDYQCFAPDIEQTKVTNHLTQEDTAESRNVLVESARIARCNIKALSEFDATAFDAIVFPGGFGAALNLSDFAIKGTDCKIEDSVQSAITAMYAAKKPIGALCIAPVLLAKVIDNAKVTIGSDEGVAGAISAFGSQHKNTTHEQIIIDKDNKLVTTPCYMLDAKISQIAAGADNLIDALVTL
ncbi:isoprenoid biosynthesis glyoxalase ElbB [Catenovulum sp. SM1970]|uniref:isoprenoid biosynthesis glyoxalase ElbB n=1 Tax=Marinifaba aquimaris TaxID=2741323 RepID=UPI0015720661|nr:isoprenoid biosynthesis glyoxalase ElbB [Marinifaba aquimaris]NTS77832.1 isoprenoid biosynthesis glyoxalase ElbB [Marinifaba aquimaris]